MNTIAIPGRTGAAPDPTGSSTEKPSRFDRLAARPGLAIAILVIASILFRAIQFGNPAVQPDDQFYLLVGDRMLHGAVPYVDIWDRKPVGLFLIYAAIRLLGGDGIIQYQLVATGFAAATAIVIRAIALRFASAPAALAAGLVYLLYLGVFGGEAGQSPVFYNLLMALAGLAIVRITARPAFDGRAIALSCAAMALTGLAMQIKYPALFEGIYFGLALIWLAHSRGRSPLTIAVLAVGWVALAVLPTAAAWAAYIAIGQGDAFFYANFVSIFERGHPAAADTIGRLIAMAAQVLPLGLAAAFSWWPRRVRVQDPQAAAAQGFVARWAIAAILGVLVFGSYYDHYALPMLLPLAIAAAPVIGDRRAGIDLVASGRRLHIAAATLLVFIATTLSVVHITKNQRTRGRGAAIRAEVAFLKPRLHDCLFVYASEPILYHLTGSCLPGRWPFPDHLNNGIENSSIGVDPLVEVARIMANKPQFVASLPRPYNKMNMRTWTYMQRELARHYRLVFSVAVGKSARLIYERRPAT